MIILLCMGILSVVSVIGFMHGYNCGVKIERSFLLGDLYAQAGMIIAALAILKQECKIAGENLTEIDIKEVNKRLNDIIQREYLKNGESSE
jgi:hypothetical protein